MTIDVLQESDNWLPKQPEAAAIKKLVGDASAIQVIESAQKEAVSSIYYILMPTIGSSRLC